MFLTSDGKPIVGGTYWPREDKEEDGKKIRGFKSVLKLVQDVWKDKKKDVLEQADKIAEATTAELAGQTRIKAILEINRELCANAVEGVMASHDPVQGGFSGAERRFRGPKFPIPPRLVLLHEEIIRKRSEPVGKALDLTLEKMARGGIYDHVGGGFHRYSTE